MGGKLIVLDGIDGSGKSTQTELLVNRLKKEYPHVVHISYPDYESPSSTLAKLYLQGKISENMNDINAYGASSFFSMDRYVSYITHWKALYEKGYIIIASRYTSANAIHQMCKLPKESWDPFLDWLFDYEYHKLQLPCPDQTIYLKIECGVADALVSKRYQGDEGKKDLHERDPDYLERCLESAEYVGKHQNWKMVSCSEQGTVLPIDTIGEQIFNIVQQII